MSNSAPADWMPALRRPPSKIGSAPSTPIPQAREDHLKRSERSVEAYPPLAVSAKLGNQAAFATPTRVCAATSEFCAAEMSGRRVSTVLGTPAGTAGRTVFHLSAGMTKVEA